MPVQKSQIIQTALSILDRDGLEGVTLRRLATDLEIKAASIYWHIANKEALLDEMANAILEEHFGSFDFTQDKRDPAEWLTTLAHELRLAMLRHREGARVVAGAHPDLAVMLTRLWDFSVRVLNNSGVDNTQAAIITVTVVNFTFGSVIEEQASSPMIENPPEDTNEGFEQFPALAKALEGWAGAGFEVVFATGVRMLVNGIRAEIAGK